MPLVPPDHPDDTDYAALLQQMQDEADSAAPPHDSMQDVVARMLQTLGVFILAWVIVGTLVMSIYSAVQFVRSLPP